MSSSEIAALFARAGASVPEAYAQLLRNPDVVPPRFQSDVLTDAAEVMQLNADVRRDGFYDEVWPDAFIALGTDPTGDIYFTDTRDPAFPVYLANHELLGSGSLLELGCTDLLAPSFEAWLESLAERNRAEEAETPYAVFAAGYAELDRLHQQPDAEQLEALFRARAVPYCALAPAHRQGVRSPLFGSMFQRLGPHGSFTLLDAAVELALRQQTECEFSAALALVAELAYVADTSEAPAGLAASWDALRELVLRYGVEDSGAWDRLRRQYRKS